MQRIEFYISLFFNHLYYCEEVDKDIEIEHVRERSTPVADGNKKKRNKRNITESLFRYRNTKCYGFTLENYSFELLLQCLKPERILFLITALLLERKLILVKENFGDIAIIMESLVSLISPLKWNFVFITYLTPNLVECIEAPFPYIIGISRRIWEYSCVMREFPDDIIIYDIDNQELLNKVREELPLLPQPQASVLQRSLKGLLDIKERFIETIQENATHKTSKEKIDEYYWAYAQLRVKQSFFNFFLLTINNYIGYFKNLDEEGDMSPQKREKQFYDKLSSVDVFDFDNYLNQFEGKNREFMEKFVKTQMFNNFIEDTYKTTSHQTMIGFFKTNFEVMLNHSFKKLKKEQNKLLDKIFFNLQNPVKFNIGHMTKEYKRKLLLKYQADVKEEGENINLKHDPIQQILLQQIMEQNNETQQLSILNDIKGGLITEMPGIQYEQIGIYEQRKTYRSEHSQEMRLHSKTAISGSTQIYDLLGQKRAKMNESEIKSRNQSYLDISKSGDIKQGAKEKGMPSHKRSGGRFIVGNDYKEFLSMADNKRSLTQSQEFGTIKELNRQHNQTQQYKSPHLSQQQQYSQDIRKINDKIWQKYRVNSENSFLKDVSKSTLNKTVVVSNSQHLSKVSTSGQKPKLLMQGQTRNDTLVNSSAKKQLNQTDAQINMSPQILKNEKLDYKKARGQLLHQSLSLLTQSKQASVLKEALTRKITYERQKQGLSSNIQQVSFPEEEKKSRPRLSHQVSIDLMNPKKDKKISRNDERRLAMKKGFLNPQQHDSLSQFIYSPNEELSKLAMMQMIQRKVESGQIGKRDQYNFSALMKQNYFSNQSDDEMLPRGFNASSPTNKIQFQKRIDQIANDPLATTINFQSNFVQQKQQDYNQSPSITNTEMSSVQKKDKLLRSDILTEEEYVMINSSSPDFKLSKDEQYQLQNTDDPQIITERQREKASRHNHTTKVIKGLKAQVSNYNTNQLSKIDSLEVKALLSSNELSQTQEIPRVKQQQQPNLSFKNFLNSMKNKTPSQKQQVKSGYRSPKNEQQSLSKLNGNIAQTFDTTNKPEMRLQTNLQRKKSSPAFMKERSPKNQSQNLSKSSINNQSDKHKSSTHFKQRPLNGGQKQGRFHHVPTATLQINLEGRSKLSNQWTASTDKAAVQLRISPVPQVNAVGNGKVENYNHSSSATSEDQVVIQTNNRSSDLQNTNDTKEIFQMSQIKQVNNESVRHNNSQKMQSQSSRMSFNRASSEHIDKKQNFRSSNLSNNLASRHSYNSTSQKMFQTQKSDQNAFSSSNQNRQSDMLTQNEDPSNKSLSVLRGSPRFLDKHESNLNFIPALKESVIEPVIPRPNTVHPSTFSSLDTQNMKNILQALKQQLPSQQSGVEVVSLELQAHKKPILAPELQRNESLHQKKQRSEANLDKLNLRDSKKHATNSQKNLSYVSVSKKNPQSPKVTSQLTASNSYLKTLQSQEFQLKEKTNRTKTNHVSTNFQSNEPLVTLKQEGFKSNKKSKPLNLNFQELSMFNKKESKLLKIDLQQSHFNTQRHQDQKNQKPMIPQILSQSTKNLRTYTSKEKILQEIDGVNDALIRIEESRQNAVKNQYNILEETLTRKSNPNASYQTSPKNFEHPSNAEFKDQSQITQEANKKSDEISNQIVTVRTHQYPQKNFEFINNLHEIQKRSEYPFENTLKRDQALFEQPSTLLGGRHSFKNDQLVLFEDEEIMKEPPLRRASRGSDRSSNCMFNSLKRKGFQTHDSESNLHVTVQTKTITNNFSQQSDDSSQPLVEIRQNFNLVKQEGCLRIRNESFSQNEILLIGGKHGDQIVRHSHTISLDSQAQHQLQKQIQVHKQGKKPQQQKHSMTELPRYSKQSMIRKDFNNHHNDDVFCRINSHFGDIDNDPHTPKSEGSPSSVEKTMRRKQSKRNIHPFPAGQEGDL